MKIKKFKNILRTFLKNKIISIFIFLLILSLFQFLSFDFSLANSINDIQNTAKPQTNYDWVASINWVVTTIIGVGLSIFTNLATPAIQNYLANFSIKLASKRLESLKKEINEIEDYYNNPLKLLAYSIEGLILALINFALAEIINNINDITGILFFAELFVSLFYIQAFYNLQKILFLFRKVKKFDEFKNEAEITKNKLEKKVNKQTQNPTQANQ